MAMTRMSETRRGPDDGTRSYRVARRLHQSLWIVRALLLFAGGCVFPPSLSVDTADAGVDSPPAIVSVRSDLQELPEPGPVTFELGAPSQLNLTLIDTDVQDTLYVRVFVGYDDPVLGMGPDPTPPRAACIAASGKTAQRTATCGLAGLCQTPDVGQNRGMTIKVFDRPVLDTGTPLYQATDPTNPGLSTSRFYYLKCQQPS
jgi:hypothetical protein